MKLPRVKPGDPLTEDLLNALIDAANRCGVSVAASSGLVLIAGLDGDTLTTAMESFLWARTTGGVSGGTYPFTQQVPQPSGTWADGPLSGVAYEQNGNTGVATGTYVKVYRAQDGSWRFNASGC